MPARKMALSTIAARSIVQIIHITLLLGKVHQIKYLFGKILEKNRNMQVENFHINH